jgi:hypothetical protein
MNYRVFFAISFPVISFLINKVPKKLNEQLITPLLLQVNPTPSVNNLLYMTVLLT